MHLRKVAFSFLLRLQKKQQKLFCEYWVNELSVKVKTGRFLIDCNDFKLFWQG